MSRYSRTFRCHQTVPVSLLPSPADSGPAAVPHKHTGASPSDNAWPRRKSSTTSTPVPRLALVFALQLLSGVPALVEAAPKNATGTRDGCTERVIDVAAPIAQGGT
jgi:hypothetical protein